MFSPKEFDSMRYKVINIEGDLLEAVPALRKFRSFVEYDGPHKNKLIVLTVVFYDKNSPLQRHFRDITLRWKEAAKIAGFDPEKDKDFLDEIYEFRPEVIRTNDEGNPLETKPCFFETMAIEYLKDQGDLTWALIVSNEKTFFEYQTAAQQIVVSFGSDKEKLNAIAVKSKLLEDSDVIAERLDSYYTKVFGEGELNRKVRQRGFTPEKVAHGV
jgi:hypothetical protein